ncbi:MAG: phosphoribosyltransferase [Spirochaetaceae bacterium]|jgi:hypoxanthine phosphoribosyltransferase|nr:phosphoribosyltransferase [Spirochaetaceae bacterium]
MAKDFINCDMVRNNGIKLAVQIYEAGFIPDVIYVSLRGGAYLGNVLSECFKMLRKDRNVMYAAVLPRLYSGIKQRNNRLVVDGWTYPPDHLRPTDKILLVDDIFDSGITINFIVDEFMNRGITRENIKVAVHDYKNFADQKDLSVRPDYYCRKFDLKDRTEDVWIHCLSHELLELTDDELDEYYYKDYPELKEWMDKLRNA